MENFRKLVAVGKRPLRPGPHRQLPISPLSYGCSRLERKMRDVGNGVGCVEPMRRACQPLFHGTFLLSESILGFRSCVLPEIRKDLRPRGLRHFLPLGGNRIKSLLSLVRSWRGYADKLPGANYDHPGHSLPTTFTPGTQPLPKRPPVSPSPHHTTPPTPL